MLVGVAGAKATVVTRAKVTVEARTKAQWRQR